MKVVASNSGFLNLDGGGRERICLGNRVGFGVYSTESEDACGAALDAGGAADAFGVCHWETLVGKVHDVNALMAD